ncbi:MAG: biotin--[acetyl-CoA-carboxylase] ligase [Tissierellia bacterium]|nr:biotin--[acetyl-CoA-carboxylase] ligase [Tissierellia bacterium]
MNIEIEKIDYSLEYKDIKKFISKEALRFPAKFSKEEYIYLEKIDSTNSFLKRNSDKFNRLIVTTNNQTKGRGKRERRWISNPGKSLICSILLKPDKEINKLQYLTLVTAASIHKALLNFDIKTLIKKPNDLYLNNKKLCGILCELSHINNKIEYLIIGFGLNVNEEFFNINGATSLFLEKKKRYDLREILTSILFEFEILYTKFLRNDLNEVKNIIENSEFNIEE